MARKFKYIAYNLLTPGLGHMAMKKWLRGGIFVLGTISCIIWLLLGIKNNIIPLYSADMDTPDSLFESENVIIALFTPIAVLIFLWILSFIDICLFCEPNLNSDQPKEIKKETQ